MPIGDETPSEWATAGLREEAVRRLAALPAEQRTRDVVAREARQIGISASTMFRLIAAWRDAPVRSTLLPERRGPKRGSLRTPLAKRQIINEAIDRLFLRREAPRMSDLCDEIEARCRSGGLTPPSRATVERHVAALDQRRTVRLREGPTAASDQFTIRSGMIEVVRPLQIVQIDHTLADVLVVDEETRVPVGRPYLTLAIDVFSRVVVGFHLTMDYPSVLSVGLCLTQAVFEKGEWLENRNIRLSWPCSGLPELLYLDNAAEFHSKALARGCEEHGIKVDFRPPRTPHFGGHIERLIGTTMGALHLLPGTTRSSVADKRDYDPEHRAAMTLRQLERWIALEIAGKYHNRIHSALGRPPMAVWNEHAANAIWKRPGDRVRFLLDFLPRCERHLQRTGIEFMKFQYSSPELRSFSIRKKTKVGVRYDPRDISRIWVEVAPGTHVEARWRDLRLPPMTLWERTSARKRLRAQGRKERDRQSIGYAVLEQRAIEDDEVRLTAQAKRNRQRRKHLVTQDHQQTPGPIAQPGTGTGESEPFTDGPLPYFETEFLHGRR